MFLHIFYLSNVILAFLNSIILLKFLVKISSLYLNKWLSYWTRYVFRTLIMSYVLYGHVIIQSKAQSAEFGQYAIGKYCQPTNFLGKLS